MKYDKNWTVSKTPVVFAKTLPKISKSQNVTQIEQRKGGIVTNLLNVSYEMAKSNNSGIVRILQRNKLKYGWQISVHAYMHARTLITFQRKRIHTPQTGKTVYKIQVEKSISTLERIIFVATEVTIFLSKKTSVKHLVFFYLEIVSKVKKT